MYDIEEMLHWSQSKGYYEAEPPAVIKDALTRFHKRWDEWHELSFKAREGKLSPSLEPDLFCLWLVGDVCEENEYIKIYMPQPSVPNMPTEFARGPYLFLVCGAYDYEHQDVVAPTRADMMALRDILFARFPAGEPTEMTTAK